MAIIGSLTRTENGFQGWAPAALAGDTEMARLSACMTVMLDGTAAMETHSLLGDGFAVMAGAAEAEGKSYSVVFTVTDAARACRRGPGPFLRLGP